MMPSDKPSRLTARPPVLPAEIGAEQARAELARLLHDSVAQTLSTMLLELFEFRAANSGRLEVVREVDRLERSTRKALSELRELLGELRARPAGDRDVVKLVKRGIRARRPDGRAVKYELIVSPGWPERIPGGTAVELQRIVAEAIENGIRHGGATRIGVSFALTRTHLAQVTITDDGRGLNGQRSAGLGVIGMRERALLLGGRVQLSSRPGRRGTIVRVTVPLAALAQTVRSSATPVRAPPRRATASKAAGRLPAAASPPAKRRSRLRSGAIR
jgi:signal transduction histidine kinase